MYGLLIENITQYIQERYGQDKWNEIRRLAKIEETTFNTHTIYPDVYTKNIIDKACQVRNLERKKRHIFLILSWRYLLQSCECERSVDVPTFLQCFLFHFHSSVTISIIMIFKDGSTVSDCC